MLKAGAAEYATWQAWGLALRPHTARFLRHPDHPPVDAILQMVRECELLEGPAPSSA